MFLYISPSSKLIKLGLKIWNKDRKKGTKVWVKSVKIFCEVMLWTSAWSEFKNMNLCHVTKWGKMADIPTLNCCYSSKWQLIRIKVCRALVTRYILPPNQNLKQVNHLYLFQVNLPFIPEPCCYAVTTSNIGL